MSFVLIKQILDRQSLQTGDNTDLSHLHWDRPCIVGTETMYKYT